ncbi:MAG: hypothetical protein ACRDKI_08965 [Solirubrobacterales bacterium]
MALVIAAALAVGGCGGKRGDAGSSHQTYKVRVVNWKFAERQPLGKPQRFVLTVRNVDSKDIPQLVITIRGLSMFVKQEGAAVKTRPVWIPNDVNYANVTPNSTATGQTFSLGTLAAGAFHRYVLPLTPIRRGDHAINYSLAGNLYGTARVQLEDGNPASDTRQIVIDPTPQFDESVFD